MRRIQRLAPAAVFLFLLFPASSLVSQSRSACTAPSYRQFDFWIGEWEVRQADGALAGANVIDTLLGGCALRERWSGSRGGRGTSLNSWNRIDRRWHQIWVDDSGLFLELEGGLEGDRMVLSGVLPSASDSTRLAQQRVTWTPLPGGNVRQL
ncbi:MAG TPA: hypothetical protein VFO06_00505 [Gemmatimonadales bacterium]|nr:hypothetical protein [Gemmatimonadales bacterium]